ncbi:hypothetical protein [Ferroplasma acidiphilum]|nr:hypothetical protein [Ferroplasma acidiphilum]WMT53770.1 MAG: hypothetical protein RE473_02725 [Ferroplasma acidiphilum]
MWKVIVFTRRPGTMKAGISAREIVIYSVYPEYFRAGNSIGSIDIYETS